MNKQKKHPIHVVCTHRTLVPSQCFELKQHRRQSSGIILFWRMTCLDAQVCRGCCRWILTRQFEMVLTSTDFSIDGLLWILKKSLLPTLLINPYPASVPHAAHWLRDGAGPLLPPAAATSPGIPQQRMWQLHCWVLKRFLIYSACTMTTTKWHVGLEKKKNSERRLSFVVDTPSSTVWMNLLVSWKTLLSFFNSIEYSNRNTICGFIPKTTLHSLFTHYEISDFRVYNIHQQHSFRRKPLFLSSCAFFAPHKHFQNSKT